MVDVSVDNEPISISLGDGQSTTVPNGEVWKVTIALGVEANSITTSEQGGWVEINGVKMLSLVENPSGNGYGGFGGSPSTQTVLVGGDTVSVGSENAGDAGAHIGGWVVDS